MQNAFQRTQRSRINSSSARVNTLPVGLFGVLRIIAFVCGPNAAANSFSSYDQKEFSSAAGGLFLKGGRPAAERGAGPKVLVEGPEHPHFFSGFVNDPQARHPLCRSPPAQGNS